MQTDILLPETEFMQDGQGPVVDTVPASCQRVTLGITQTLEHEKLDVSIWGSPDGQDWGMQPLAEFPSKCYCGVYSLLLDLSAHPAIRHLRATWTMRAWAAGNAPDQNREPLFGFYLNAEPVSKPPGAVAAAKARAAAA
jgi:hypothetical protein